MKAQLTQMVLRSTQEMKEATKRLETEGIEDTDVLVNDITIMQTIATIAEDLSDKVTPVHTGILVSIGLMQLGPDMANKIVDDYVIKVTLAK